MTPDFDPTRVDWNNPDVEYMMKHFKMATANRDDEIAALTKSNEELRRAYSELEAKYEALAGMHNRLTGKGGAAASGDMPLFRDDESRTSDPGNRCKLRFRHALLMSLIRKKDNPTQGTLQAIFGVDQTSVCRYLKVMDRILASVLPTAKNVSKEIAACKTKEEFKIMVPGPGGGDVTADGTHCPVQRPSEKTVRRMIYSGKKKRFAYNTNVYTNADGVVVGISRSSVGSTGDITLSGRIRCRLASGPNPCATAQPRKKTGSASGSTGAIREPAGICPALRS